MVIFGIAFGIVIPRSTDSCKGDKKAWSLLGQRHQASNKKSQNLQGVREEWRLEEYARKKFHDSNIEYRDKGMVIEQDRRMKILSS